MPATPIASHQTTTGNRPSRPTDNPIGIKAVTSPNPNDRGTSNANANWIRQHSTVNNSACNSTNRSFATTPCAKSAANWINAPTATHAIGTRR